MTIYLYVVCQIVCFASRIFKYYLLDLYDKKQAISARERALCQLTVCFEFQSRSDRRKGHKICALQMVFRRKVTR